MMHGRPWLALCAVLLALPALAADDAYPALLPPEPLVRQVLTQLPPLQAAQHAIRLEQANRSRLLAGSHEWNLRAMAQQRRELNGPRFMETELLLERPLRSADKAGKDAALGEQGLATARLAMADSWHEAARSLLKVYFEVLRTRLAAAGMAQQSALSERLLQQAGRRVAAGEAPRVDLLLAEAERERVAALQLQAAQRAELAAMALQASYPGLPLPTQPGLPEPVPAPGGTAGQQPGPATAPAGSMLPVPLAPAGDDTAWLARMLDDNHEIELAEAELRQARLRAERLGLERRPDPSVSARLAQERNNQDRLIGVMLSIPLGGNWRSAQHEAGLAQAAMAEERWRQTRMRVQAEAARVLAAARHGVAVWEKQRQVARQTAANADLSLRAYSLGEGSLSDGLQGRRLALDAMLAAQSAQIDALEAHSRLLLDAHAIWAFAHPAEAGSHKP